MTDVSDTMVATTFEAVLGAVSQDGGDGAVENVVKKVGLAKHALLVSFKDFVHPAGVSHADLLLTYLRNHWNTRILCC